MNYCIIYTLIAKIYMKNSLFKYVLVGILLGAVIVLGVFAWDLYREKPDSFTNSNFTGSDLKGNYVYGAAMNLAWNELSENIVKEKIQLNTTDPAALKTTELLNTAKFTKKDLDAASYYIKSGYGQETVDLINKESREKFPEKSFQNLQLELEPEDIISYAYFLKKVEYPVEFSKKEISFHAGVIGSTKVKGFFAESDMQQNNVRVINYWTDDKFLIELKLKDPSDRLILAKGFDMSKPDAVLNTFSNKYQKTNRGFMLSSDTFAMPNLSLDLNRKYDEMIGECLANENFKAYCINVMFENIKFDLDNKGARVENEAVIGMAFGSSRGPSTQPKPRHFILDKPFWVIMQRSDSSNPYFVLGVNNAELMEK